MEMESKKIHKWHVKPRIFLMLLLLLAVVFSSVFVAFNLFVSNYIRSNVETQLNDLVKDFGIPNDAPPDKPKQDGIDLPDLTGQRKNKIGARGEVIILDSGYSIKSYNEFSINEDLDELTQIASYLKEKNVPLEDARYVFVDTDQGEYYISSVEDTKQPGSYFVFYVSVAGLNHLVDTINLAMAVLVAAAMLICFFVANVVASSITKPVKALSSFAEEIGKGNFQRKALSFQDVEFDELGEVMNQSAEKLDAYDKDQKAFFQNVSHELRTPLQSIRCYAEGVEYGLMDPKKSGATIISETDRLSELVEDLLYISRVDSLTGRVELRENDLRETLALCAESLRPVAGKTGLAIKFEFDHNPVLLSYNEKHMYRAFSNLIANALRYAETTITLRCGRDGDQVAASVIDDGPGVSAEDLPHIFERFYKGRDGKHGIGLAIVKSVVELHGGTITANCDKGTSFTMRFPAN